MNTNDDLTELSPCGKYRTINVDLLWEPPSWWGPELQPAIAKSGLYSITSRGPDGVRYLGSSVNLGRREACHFDRLAKHKHENAHLQAAYDKDPTSLRFRIIEEITIDHNTTLRDLRAREQKAIAKELSRGIDLANVAGNPNKAAARRLFQAAPTPVPRDPIEHQSAVLSGESALEEAKLRVTPSAKTKATKKKAGRNPSVPTKMNALKYTSFKLDAKGHCKHS